MLFNIMAMMNIYKSSNAFLKHHLKSIPLLSVSYPTTCPCFILCYRPSSYAPLVAKVVHPCSLLPHMIVFFYSAQSNLHWWSVQNFSLNMDPLCSGKNASLWPCLGPRWLDTPPQYLSSLGTMLQQQLYNFFVHFFLSYSQWCRAILKIKQKVSEGWTIMHAIDKNRKWNMMWRENQCNEI